MSMELEIDYVSDEEEVETYGDHEISPHRKTRIDHRESDLSCAAESSVDDKDLIQRGCSSQKRRAESEAIDRILKRHKGLYNNNYLNLLNQDIENAANHIVVGEEGMPPSQVGLTVWTPFEKKLFFEALSRLGKGDLQGIASRIRTKSEIEVRQYIALLQDAAERREQEQEDGLDCLELAEYPAAVEISQPCCHVLEEAADALSLRQERHEEAAEQKKWGDYWNINQEVAKFIEGDHGLEKSPRFAGENGLEFAEVFRIKSWLRLSERVFMNASHAENNWRFVSEEPPTIRATALQDFHSLLVSITKRAVLTTLFVAESRIRAKRKVEPATRGLVRRKDVEAAVASLSMKQNGNEFWATCARRLRLEVWDDETQREGNEAEEQMTYEQIERILRRESTAPEPSNTDAKSPTPETGLEDEESTESANDSDSDSIDLELEHSAALNDAEHDVTEEAKEVLVYSAYDFPETHRTREALKLRIKNERAQEVFAEAEDAKASYESELEMWRLLERQQPEPLGKPIFVNRNRRAIKGVEDLYDVGRQWRERLTYYSEWEMLGTAHLHDKQT